MTSREREYGLFEQGSEAEAAAAFRRCLDAQIAAPELDTEELARSVHVWRNVRSDSPAALALQWLTEAPSTARFTAAVAVLLTAWASRGGVFPLVDPKLVEDLIAVHERLPYHDDSYVMFLLALRGAKRLALPEPLAARVRALLAQADTTKLTPSVAALLKE